MVITVTANASIDKRAVVESFEENEVNRITSCTYSAGGKGLNVSRSVRLCDDEVLATGFLGGFAGRYIEQELQKEGIPSDFVWCWGESRSCLNIWNQEKKEQTEFLEPGFPSVKEKEEELVRKIDNLLEKADVLTISGSMPKGSGAAMYQELLRIGRKRGKKVLLDTSGSLLSDCLEGEVKPFLIKPNMDEIQMLAGRTITSFEELMEAAAFLQKRGIEAVMISMGEKGAILSSREGVYSIRVPKVKAVNTVGCGDVMIGGMAVGLDRKLSLPECLRLAGAASAAAAKTERTGFFYPKDKDELLGEITVEKLR